jgi:chromosome segregation protein
MRIKQIELNGFKSFMERTVLELPAGVTAVVGPNGCGKSNIVDAIRWVLGEQSPRHLRGSAMEDVVFNGNAESGPMGMAEVSLLLERDEADLVRAAADSGVDDEALDGLPPELAKVSEILVTRRYFRSGESEYFINRAACRLKDITELFLGTGIGTRAYAIIEQGRVDQLVNAKPDELRLFLEEAAGTTRFRSRKIAAERKMERTRENLVRVQDVLREIERQMASLERQARRAEEYHRIKHELRDLDLRVMAERQRAWSGELAELGARLAAIHLEEEQLQETIRRSRGAYDEAQAARAANEDRLRGIEAEITTQRLTAGEAQARASSLTARAAELAARATEGAVEIERLRKRQHEGEAEAAVLGSQVAALEADLPSAEADHAAAEACLEALAAQGVPLEEQLEAAKDGVLAALGEETRLRNLAEALRVRHDDLVGRRRRLEDEQRTLGERLHANSQATETVRANVETLHAEQARLLTEREVRQARRAALVGVEGEQSAVVDGLHREVTQLRSRAESLRELEARYEGCTRGVASLLGRDGQAAALLASVLRVPEDLERAVAAALGTRLGQLVVDDTSSAVDAIRWLRETASGSATILPRAAERRAAVIVPAGQRLVDSIEVEPQHWALIEGLLGHVLLAPDLDSALQLWRDASHAVTVVTRHGEAIDALGAVTGGSEPPLEETLLARQRELRELESSIGDAEARAIAAQAELARLRAELVEIAGAIVEVDEQQQAARVALVAAEKDRERLEAERVRIGAELEAGALEAGGLAGEDGEVSGEIAAVEERVTTAARVVAEGRARLAERQAALAMWRDRNSSAERERTTAAVRVAAVVERLRSARADCARCVSARAEVETQLSIAEHRTEEARQGAESAERDAAGALAARDGAEREVARCSREREDLAAAMTEADTSASADDATERAAREQLEAAREQRSRLDVLVAEKRLAIEHLVAQLAERYALPPTALDEVLVEADGLDVERAARVESLRARLARLGDVNPAAIEELEELRTRHGFLVAQQSDLESSLEDLRRTITKLTRTSRQRFEETFAAANVKLSELFPKLFPGGKAHLELLPAEEDAEAGVEIIVQPAGKKLQSLSLLSGGEKALTAVSLILSLFLIRPTPFCLLDEVDAPLDEANIGRFNLLIREMATTSQFVLITHNRRTMQAADTLYGITMEQAGVSKVVSVRLREAA